jgi:hypothetical protein
MERLARDSGRLRPYSQGWKRMAGTQVGQPYWQSFDYEGKSYQGLRWAPALLAIIKVGIRKDCFQVKSNLLTDF